MKPNFEQMSIPDLRAYVLKHRDDIEAIRALFYHPRLKWKTMPPMFTEEGVPLEKNIRVAEEAILQLSERDREKNNPMTTITQAEIEQFRLQLAAYPEALEALNVIENCEGDLEDAVLVLAKRAKIEVVRAPKRLDEYAKQLREVLCRKEFREDLLNNSFNVVVGYLFINPPTIPLAMVTPVLIYVTKRGLNKWCEDG